MLTNLHNGDSRGIAHLGIAEIASLCMEIQSETDEVGRLVMATARFVGNFVQGHEDNMQQ